VALSLTSVTTLKPVCTQHIGEPIRETLDVIEREATCRTILVYENQRETGALSGVAIANVDADIVKLRDAPTKVAVQGLVVTRTLQHRHYIGGLRVW